MALVTPFIFQIVGYQNSGKTTFLNQLISHLTAKVSTRLRLSIMAMAVNLLSQITKIHQAILPQVRLPL